MKEREIYKGGLEEERSKEVRSRKFVRLLSVDVKLKSGRKMDEVAGYDITH